MANQFTRQVIEEGWRNAIVLLSGVIDTQDMAIEPAFALQDCINNDTANQRLVGFRVDHIWHSIGDGLEIIIKWAAAPQDFLIMAVAGRGRESFEVVGGIQPPINAPGYQGDIHLYSSGFNTSNAGIAPQNFTVLLEMVKIYKR